MKARLFLGVQTREDRFSLFLLSLSYGVYFFFLTLSFFIGDGVSEAEEWHIFVISWLVAPVCSLAVVFAICYIRRTCCTEVTAFYPSLLGVNALFWFVYFAYQFLSSWILSLYDFPLKLVMWIVLLFPLLNLATVLVLRKHRNILANHPSIISWIFSLLPLVVLLICANFTDFRPTQRHLQFQPLMLSWPRLGEKHGVVGGENLAQMDSLKQGQSILQTRGQYLNLEVTSRVTGVLRVTLPWNVLEDVRARTWLVEEGAPIDAGQPLLEMSSDQLHVVVITKVSGTLSKITLFPGEYPKFNIPFCTISSVKHQVMDLVGWAILLGLLALFHGKWIDTSWRRLYVYALDITVVLAVALLVFDPAFPFDQHHYNFFLGPVNDFLRGKSMLVDINCQYGVGVIYFLAALFGLGLAPLTYQGLSCIINILLILQYGLLYLLLRHVLKSPPFSALILFLILTANFFSQRTNPNFPSVGPLRFGLVYLVLAAVLLRNAYPRLSRISWFLAYIVTALASIWSVETFFYVLSTHVAILLHEFILNTSSLRQFLYRSVRALVSSLLAIGLTHLLLALHIHSRSGEWPHWDRYLDYITLYSVGEFATLPVDPWSPWALITAIYFASLLLLVYRTIRSPAAFARGEASLITGMTVFGIAQFTYFLGRSHPNNLYHICIPAVFLAAYWLCQMTKDAHLVPAGFRRSSTYCFYVAASLLFLTEVPNIVRKREHTAAYALFYQGTQGPSLCSREPTDPQVEEALCLIQKHAPDRERIPLFIAPELTTETLMLSEKANIFPLSNPVQDYLLESASTQALRFDHGLQSGDILFLARDTGQLNALQLLIVKRLREEFIFILADATSQVYAIRLEARTSASVRSPF